MVIAPLNANAMAKIANGLCDNLNFGGHNAMFAIYIVLINKTNF